MLVNGAVPFEFLAGALLHDIGKFASEAGESGEHEELSRKFVERHRFPGDRELISQLVLNHHMKRIEALPPGRTKTLASMICEADSISANTDKKYDENKEPNGPLRPVFSEFFGDAGEATDYYYGPVKLTLNAMEAVRTGRPVDIKGEYRTLWNEFEREIDRLPADGDFLIRLFYLLRKYTSFVLSAGYQRVPDMSLFDHLKTTAAIASALYLWAEKNGAESTDGDAKPYLVVEGDLSGIQRYITEVSNPEEARKGASKRMRGRSMWLNLLMDSVATRIVEDLGLTEMSILWCTGGHFLIIAPNTETAKISVEKVRKAVNSELFTDHDGKVFMALDWLECSGGDLREFSRVRSELSGKLDVQKKRKFLDLLKSGEAAGEGYSEESDRYCHVCGRYTGGGRCRVCENHEDLGQRLAKAEYMVKESSQRFDFSFPTGVSYDFLRNKQSKGRVYRLNSTDFVEDSVGFRFIGNTVPKDERGDVLTFEDIALTSTGAKKIGVLKADVDGLGRAFGDQRMSISKVHQLSSLIELFFAGCLNTICSRDRYNGSIYIIYSGGDDLLITGAYDAVVELAGDLSREFDRFSCGTMTLSAGVSVIDPHYPISRAVVSVNERLEKAKANEKKSITVFGETVKWKSDGYIIGFYDLLQCGREMEDLLERGEITSSFVYSLFNMWELTWGDERDVSNNSRIKKKYLPLLKYQLVRNVKDAGVREDIESKVKPCMPWIRIPASWVSLRKREVKNE